MQIGLMSSFDRRLFERAGLKFHSTRRCSDRRAADLINRVADGGGQLIRPPFPVEATLGRIALKRKLNIPTTSDGTAAVPMLRVLEPTVQPEGTRVPRSMPKELRKKLIEHRIQHVLIFGEKGFFEASLQPQVGRVKGARPDALRQASKRRRRKLCKTT